MVVKQNADKQKKGKNKNDTIHKREIPKNAITFTFSKN